MELTVLGCSACVQNPGDACSGYLLRDERSAILIDCGPGVVGNLRRHIDMRDLDGILVTHMHQDHFLDLIPLRCGLRYLAPVTDTALAAIPVYLPPGGIDVLTRVMSDLPMSDPDIGPHGPRGALDDTFVLHEFLPGEEFRLKSFTARFEEAVHDIPAWSVVIESARRFAFSGDTGPCDGVVEIAKGADLFLCEAGSPDRPELEIDLVGVRCHLTAQEAGRIARDASAGQLVLTHLWAEYDAPARVNAAREEFGDRVELAQVNRTFHF